MILEMEISEKTLHNYPKMMWPYHRLVNTTPKPSATKNSSGELELLAEFVLGGAVAVELGLDVSVDIVQVDTEQLECPKDGFSCVVERRWLDPRSIKALSGSAMD